MTSKRSASTGLGLAGELSGEHGYGSNPATFSIRVLFQITTASALFFTCLRFSPLLAILLTIVFAPALIRTGQISEIHRQNKLQFGLAKRLSCFLGSIAFVLFTAAFALLVFVAVSLGFGLLGMLLSTSIGSRDLNIEAAIVGTAGGMIWGFAGALLATGLIILRLWLPKEILVANHL